MKELTASGMATACLRLLAASLVIAASLVGCASAPVGDPQQDAMLKAVAAAPDRAGIDIYRSEPIATAYRIEVFLDGAPLGQTAGRTYLYAEVAPGRHTVTSNADNIATLEVNVEPGSLTFVWQEVTAGWFRPRNKLHLMSETQGREGVRGGQTCREQVPDAGRRGPRRGT